MNVNIAYAKLLNTRQFDSVFPSDAIDSDKLHLIAEKIRKTTENIIFDLFGDSVNDILCLKERNKKTMELKFHHPYFDDLLEPKNRKRQADFVERWEAEINKIDFETLYKEKRNLR